MGRWGEEKKGEEKAQIRFLQIVRTDFETLIVDQKICQNLKKKTLGTCLARYFMFMLVILEV